MIVQLFNETAPNARFEHFLSVSLLHFLSNGFLSVHAVVNHHGLIDAPVQNCHKSNNHHSKIMVLNNFKLYRRSIMYCTLRHLGHRRSTTHSTYK